MDSAVATTATTATATATTGTTATTATSAVVYIGADTTVVGTGDNLFVHAVYSTLSGAPN
jgi:hypothetical protein